MMWTVVAVVTAHAHPYSRQPSQAQPASHDLPFTTTRPSGLPTAFDLPNCQAVYHSKTAQCHLNKPTIVEEGLRVAQDDGRRNSQTMIPHDLSPADDTGAASLADSQPVSIQPSNLHAEHGLPHPPSQSARSVTHADSTKLLRRTHSHRTVRVAESSTLHPAESHMPRRCFSMGSDTNCVTHGSDGRVGAASLRDRENCGPSDEYKSCSVSEQDPGACLRKNVANVLDDENQERELSDNMLASEITQRDSRNDRALDRRAASRLRRSSVAIQKPPSGACRGSVLSVNLLKTTDIVGSMTPCAISLENFIGCV